MFHMRYTKFRGRQFVGYIAGGAWVGESLGLTLLERSHLET